MEYLFVQGCLIDITCILERNLFCIWATAQQNQQNDLAPSEISLGIRPVWLESSLWAQWVAESPWFLYEDSKESDQTGWMPRLTWVVAGRTGHLVGFVMHRLIYCNDPKYWDRHVWPNSAQPDQTDMSGQTVHNQIRQTCLGKQCRTRSDRHVWVNSAEPDHSEGAVRSGSTPFAPPSPSSRVKPCCSYFRIITAIFSGVWMFFYFYDMLLDFRKIPLRKVV